MVVGYLPAPPPPPRRVVFSPPPAPPGQGAFLVKLYAHAAPADSPQRALVSCESLANGVCGVDPVGCWEKNVGVGRFACPRQMIIVFHSHPTPLTPCPLTYNRK